MAIAVTSISGTDVVVQWTAPFNNYQPVLEYDIIFLSSTGAYVQAETECSGQDPSITTCVIDMHRMRSLTSLARH